MSGKPPTPVRHIVFEVEPDVELDYSACYYEGDTPEPIITNVFLKQISVKDLIDSLTKQELKELGLQKTRTKK
jgi:hypothetical protein